MATPSISISATQTGSETDLSPSIFTLTRTGNLDSELTVNLLLQGTAKAGADYTAALGENNTLAVTFAADSATATLNLPTLSDNVIDSYDNILAILQSGEGYSLTPGKGRAEVIISAEGVTAVPNRRSYWGKSGGEYKNTSAFAVLKEDGSVVTWGNNTEGGNSSAVADRLTERVTQIFSTRGAFAALKEDGSVVTWGNSTNGGNSSSVASRLTGGVTQIFSTGFAFAALKDDGSLVTWGDNTNGGNSSSVSESLTEGVTQIFSTRRAFAVLKDDGSVVTWGLSHYGGNSSSVSESLTEGVTQIFSTGSAFAALKEDGSVVTWGSWGGNSSSVANQLSGGVTQIFSTGFAFAALKEDGSVVTWGSNTNGGNSSAVADRLTEGVTQIFSTRRAFAVLKEDGSVVTWGDNTNGGNSSAVADRLTEGVTQIFSTRGAFAALKEDGSVVTWGNNTEGGDSSAVADRLTEGVSQIFSTGSAFAVLKEDGSVVTWGDNTNGGDSSSVAKSLSSGVVGFATPFTDDSFNGIPSISISATQAGSENNLSPSIFTLTRTGNLDSELTVNLLLQGTAKAGADYTASLGENNTLTVTFAAGSATATLNLPTLADEVVDSYDNILAILQSRSSYRLTPGEDRAEVIISAEGVTAVPNRRSYFGKSGGEYKNSRAFAALKEDGSVVTWGDSGWGGDSRSVANQLKGGVTQIFSNEWGDFAALKADGSVVTWGTSWWGGDSSRVASQLRGGVTQIFSTRNAFAALKEDGSVVTWGHVVNGGNSSRVANQLSGGVTQIFSTRYAFAALREDGSVVTWGHGGGGGNSSRVANQLTGGVTQIFSTVSAFAALKEDGSVVTWGYSIYGGKSTWLTSHLSGGVTKVFSTATAFAALKEDGSVVTWGSSRFGGNSSSVSSRLTGGVTQIFSTGSAFAALKEDGSVVTWGGFGGNSSSVSNQLTGGVTQIFSTQDAFAALKEDGSVVTWGGFGGNSSSVSNQLTGGVTQIFSTQDAFAALKEDGSVVTWGGFGGNSSSVSNQLTGGVTQIFSTQDAFAALKEDGSVVTWGGFGGNSSAVADRLSSGVVGFATPFTNDFFNNASTENSPHNEEIGIPPANEAPIFNNQTFTLAENSPNNTVISRLKATDAEGNNLTYTMTNNFDSNNNGIPAFGLQGNQLMVNDSNDLDYENNPTLSITVQASDGSETDDATITVNLKNIIGEYGTLNNLNHEWQTINLNESYINPVVIVSDPTFEGRHPAVIRLQNVGSNSFQLRLQEPNYKDGWHKNESVSYLVMEAGDWTLSDGTRISAGTHSSNRLTPAGFETINLTGFDGTPTVLSQVQTFNGRDWVTTRTQGQSSNSFQVAMQEEEARNNGGHATETIGWLAIDQGAAENGDILLQGGTTGRAHNHSRSTVSFSEEFDSTPSVIAKLGSYYGPNTANIRLDSITSTEFGVSVQEEQSLDSEIWHTTESISFLVLEDESGFLSL